MKAHCSTQPCINLLSNLLLPALAESGEARAAHCRLAEENFVYTNLFVSFYHVLVAINMCLLCGGCGSTRLHLRHCVLLGRVDMGWCCRVVAQPVACNLLSAESMMSSATFWIHSMHITCF